MRVRRSFERPEGKKSAKLIVIASEGVGTETIYFNAVKDCLCARNVHMKILERETTDSSPEVVLSQLKQFEAEYSLEEDDELWMVIDRDRWTDKTLSDVAQKCHQNKYLFFAMSNPCFELWLLLHFEDINEMSEVEVEALKANKRVSKRGDKWLKSRVRRCMGSYHETGYDTDLLMPYVKRARDRAEALDTEKKNRWPQTIGTRVYRLIDSITAFNQ